MAQTERIAILSDVHYAGPAEQARGNDYEYRDLKSPWQRAVCRTHRHFIWLRNPLNQNHLLDDFLRRVGEPDHVFALGDYTCDTGFVGVSDDAALESACLCLGKLRACFGDRLHALIGDHELGKFPLFGSRGGLRLESWRRVNCDLGLSPFWQFELGPYACLGITSTLVALPAFEREMIEAERVDWNVARERHLAEIREAFNSLAPDKRVLLFCHDPTALPYLWHEPAVRNRIGQIEQTFIGHLHSPLILWKSRRLAGMPTVAFMGNTVKRLSTALRRARDWKPFKLRLCPSLAGIQLLRDGGFYTAEVNAEAGKSLYPQFHRIKR